MDKLNSHARGFLMNLVKASGNSKELNNAKKALTIINRGVVFNSDLIWMKMRGYKE